MFNGIPTFNDLVLRVKNLIRELEQTPQQTTRRTRQKSQNPIRSPRLIELSANPLLVLANKILDNRDKKTINIDGQIYRYDVTYEDNRQNRSSETKIYRAINPNIRFLDIELVPKDSSNTGKIKLRAANEQNVLRPLSIISKGSNGLASYSFTGTLRIEENATSENTKETYQLSGSEISKGHTKYNVRVNFT